MSRSNQTSTRMASFQYIQDLDLYKREKPYMVAGMDHVPTDKRSNIEVEWRDGVPVHDIRAQKNNFTIERNSFEVMDCDYDLPPADNETAMESHISHVSRVLEKRFGAERVICYESLYRQSEGIEKKQDGDADADQTARPVAIAHMDHTKNGGLYRIKHHLTDDEAEHYLSDKYQSRIFNVWRSYNKVVEDQPLAFVDSNSLHSNDLVSIDRVTPTYYGEVTYLKHSPSHKWHYLSQQRQDEAILFLSFDSEGEGQSNFCAHASFLDDTASKDAAPRRSVELRFIVFNVP